MRWIVIVSTAVLATAPLGGAASVPARPLPEGFVYLADVDGSIRQDMRYATARNFTSAPVPGYEAPECVLLAEAAEALRRVQAGLRARGHALKIYDCYRPRRAVAAFMAWTEGKGIDAKSYYPRTERSRLVAEGYIAARSGHSTGAAVDLTMAALNATLPPPASGTETGGGCTAPASQRAPDDSVDMGTSFDCFDVKSWTASSEISPEQRQLRQLLVDAMTAQGFENFDKEWWHFSLTNARRERVAHDFPITARAPR